MDDVLAYGRTASFGPSHAPRRRLRGEPDDPVDPRKDHGAHELRHNYTTLATRAAVPFMEQRMLMTHAVPGIGQVYTHPETLVEHVRQYVESIELLVATEAPALF